MSIRVLLADDHKIVRDGLGRMLTGHEDIEVIGHVENGVQAVDLATQLHPDIVVMDVGMPKLGGVAATRRIVDETSGTRVIALSMHSDWRYVSAMLDAGASAYVLKDAAFDELTKAIHEVTADRQFISSAVCQGDLRIPSNDITGTEPLAHTRSSLADVVGRVVEFRDPYTAGHQRRVAALAAAMAEELDMSGQEVETIRTAGLLHDVGKMGVPAEILSRPGALSPAEMQLVRGHAEAGYQIISSTDQDAVLAQIIYQHHERCDGSGYPQGLTGDAMLVGAKILAVADVVEAMASHRPYRAGLGIDAALHEIECGVGTLYDAAAVQACIRIVRKPDFEFSA